MFVEPIFITESVIVAILSSFLLAFLIWKMQVLTSVRGRAAVLKYTRAIKIVVFTLIVSGTVFTISKILDFLRETYPRFVRLHHWFEIIHMSLIVFAFGIFIYVVVKAEGET